MPTLKITFNLLCLFFILSLPTHGQKNTDNKQIIDSLRLVLATEKDEKVLIKTYRELVYYYNNTSGFDSSIVTAKRGLALAEKIHDTTSIVKMHSGMGVASWNMAEYNKALAYYVKGLRIAVKNEDLSSLYNNIGLVYWDKGELSTSLRYFLLSYEMDKATNNIEGMSSSMLNIGLIYDDLNDYNNALKYYFQALVMIKQIKDQKGEALCYNNIGKVYNSRHDKYKAFDYYTKSYNLSKKISDKRNMAMSGNNIGTMYSDDQDYEKAELYYNTALKVYKEIGDLAGRALVLGNMGDLYNRKGQYPKAIEIYKEARVLNDTNGFIDDQVLVYRGLSLAYSQMGNYGEAYKSLEKYNVLNDSLTNLNNMTSLNEVQKDYEIKQREKEINIKREAEKAIAASEKRRQNFVIVFIILILVIVVVFSFFLFKRFKLTQKQKEIIEKQKHLVEEHRKEVLDSIHYAKRIQNTLLANSSFIQQHLPEHFIFFKPKDIVSGDYYWATSVTGSLLQVPGSEQETNNKKPITNNQSLFYLAVCDSTGHGVPGAFMSLLNIGFLSEAINEKKILEPNMVFNHVRQRLVDSISKEGQKDGFDGILLCLNKTTGNITYAAANNAPVIISGNNIEELAVDKMPVGQGEKLQSFSLNSIHAKPGDIIYLYTDGYADQFGGPKGKKFKYRQLNELLLKISVLPLSEQKEVLEKEFLNWKGDLEQLDDICVIGIKV